MSSDRSRSHGTTQLLFSQFSAKFQHAERYLVRVTPGNLQSEPRQFECTAKTSKPDWLEDQDIAISVFAGTFALKIDLAKSSGWSTPVPIASAEVPLHWLVPGQPVVVKLSGLGETPKGSSRTPPSPGDLTLCISEVVSVTKYHSAGVQSLVPNYPAIALLQRVHNAVKSLQGHNCPRPELLNMIEVYCESTLMFLCTNGKYLKNARGLSENSPVLAALAQLDRQFVYFALHAWPNADNRITNLASGFLEASFRTMALAYSLMPFYIDANLDEIAHLSAPCRDASAEFPFHMLVFRAQMQDIAPPGAHITMPESDLYMHVAAIAIAEYAGVRGEYTGKCADFLFSLRNTLAAHCLNCIKDLVDQTKNAPDKAKYRSAARRLMTRIAHLANAMPTRLELVKGEIEETEHAPAAMLNLNETNGGYGDVSFGKMNKPGVQRAVAIKTFVANVVVKKTYIEILAGWTLSHPNILPTFGITHVIRNGRLSLITPRIPGGSLFKYSRNRPEFLDLKREEKVAAINTWLRQAASALCYLHQEEIVHADIHGDNVLIDGRKGRENDIVLADFGLSVYTEAVSKAFDSTRRGKGNILAPELSLGRGLDPTQQNAAPAPPGPPGTIPPVPAQLGPDVSPTGRATPASDLFAFAMLCIQLYTQEDPFGPNAQSPDVIMAIRRGQRPGKPALLTDDRLWRRIQICWSQEPRERGDTLSLLKDLQAVSPDPADALAAKLSRTNI